MRVASSTAAEIHAISALYELDVAVGPFILSSCPAWICISARSYFFISVGPIVYFLLRY